MAPKAQFLLSIAASAALVGTAALAAPVIEGGKRYTVNLTGAAEVPDADPDGTGTAIITVNKGQGRVCWEISWSNIATPTAAHIHIGLEETAPGGNIVLPLEPIASGCEEDVRADLISALIGAPEAFYVNVHNADFPGGAIRGQLG